jgi:hypothetical protein
MSMKPYRGPANLYFGCDNKESGHYLWKSGQDHLVRCERELGTDRMGLGFDFHMLDGGFLPYVSLKQGEAYLTHFGNWTIVSFADFSVDSRPGSHSTFLCYGRVSYGAAIEAARQFFPRVWSRYKFTVDLAPDEPAAIAEEAVRTIAATVERTRKEMVERYEGQGKSEFDKTLIAKAIELERERVEQLTVQLAGCSAAAMGFCQGDKLWQKCERGDYGWSVALEDVKVLYQKYSALLPPTPAAS